MSANSILETFERCIPLRYLIAAIISLIVASLISQGGAIIIISVMLVSAVGTIYFISKGKKIVLYLIMLFTFYFYPFHEIFYLNLYNFINPLTIAGLILLYYIFNIDVQPAMKKHYKYIKICYILFFIVGIIGSFSTISRLGALNWLFFSLITGFVVFKYLMIIDYSTLIRIIDYILIFGVIEFMFGITEYLSGHYFIFSSLSHRYTSLLGQPLANAFVFGILIFMTLFRYSVTKRKRYILFALMYFLAIVLTLSRGAWLSLLVIIVITILRYGVRYKYIVLAAVIAIIFILSPLRNIVTTRIASDESGKHSSWNVRIESLKIGKDIIQEHPLVGIGLFNSKRYKNEYTYDKLYGKSSFENSMYQIIVEVGILGSIPYFLIMLYTLLVLYRKRGHISHLMFSMLIYMLIDAATFNILNIHRQSHFIYWTVLAISLRVASNENTVNQ
ncbi:MAG: O-antigen ligase family protein [Candidatus Omnitrophica bacterium]|nr:O-antigen ligase family protein [Candidatus Omnitrophota bacterium]